MAMRRRRREEQADLFVTADRLPQSDGHVFFVKLNELLAEGGFDLLRRAGFERLYPVNPKNETVQGLRAWPDIESVPEVVDLAILAMALKREFPDAHKYYRHPGLKFGKQTLRSANREAATPEDRAQMVRDVLRGLGQPVKTSAPATT